MTPKTPQTIRLKYIGDYKASTEGVGITVPGQIVELPYEFGSTLPEQDGIGKDPGGGDVPVREGNSLFVFLNPEDEKKITLAKKKLSAIPPKPKEK